MDVAERDIELKERLGGHQMTQDYIRNYFDQQSLNLARARDARERYQILNQVAAEWARVDLGNRQLANQIYEFGVTRQWQVIVNKILDRLGVTGGVENIGSASKFMEDYVENMKFFYEGGFFNIFKEEAKKMFNR